jgi:DNA (cytosine-5)-methyltransferase 1
MPTHLDLFSGIGGFALAAQWAGFRTVAFVELDKYCQKVLAKNFGAVLADAMRGGCERDSGNAGTLGEAQREQEGVESESGDVASSAGSSGAGHCQKVLAKNFMANATSAQDNEQRRDSEQRREAVEWNGKAAQQDHGQTDHNSTHRRGEDVADTAELHSYGGELHAGSYSQINGQKSDSSLQFRNSNPKVRIHGNIFDFDGTAYRGVDLITGGFPCQPFSVAGKRRGAADDRAIWPQMFRVIKEARPAWVLGENVPGLIPMELDNVLSDMEGIGYATRTFVIPACAVDARHRRDRLWIVGRRIDAYADKHIEPRLSEHEQREVSRPVVSDFGCAGLEGCAATGNSGGSGAQREEQSAGLCGTQDMADTANGGQPMRGRSSRNGRHALRGDLQTEERTGITWLPEPDVGGAFDGLSRWLDGFGGLNAKATANVGAKMLCALWDRIIAQALQWSSRGFVTVSPEAVLFAALCKSKGWSFNEARLLMAGEKALEANVRGVWYGLSIDCPSCGSRHSEQQSREHSDSLQVVSRLLARDAEKIWIEYRRSDASPVLGWETGFARVAHGVQKRVDRLKGLGNAIVPQVAYELLREIRKLI